MPSKFAVVLIAVALVAIVASAGCIGSDSRTRCSNGCSDVKTSVIHFDANLFSGEAYTYHMIDSDYVDYGVKIIGSGFTSGEIAKYDGHNVTFVYTCDDKGRLVVTSIVKDYTTCCQQTCTPCCTPTPTPTCQPTPMPTANSRYDFNGTAIVPPTKCGCV